MHVEALTLGKNPAAPQANEDRLLIYGDTTFGVIDGVTDKSGKTYGGRTGGRLAGALIDDALRDVVRSGEHMTAPAADIFSRVDAEFQRAYERLGITETVQSDASQRFAAQLAVVFSDGQDLRLLQTGDCGARLNGSVLHLRSNPADDIMGLVRSRVFHHLVGAGASPEEALAAARSAIVQGLDEPAAELQALLGEGPARSLCAELLSLLPAQFPDVDERTVLAAARGGLVGLARARNRSGALGVGGIDGFGVDHRHVTDLRFSWSDVAVVELFTDGYFGVPEQSGTVTVWEEHLARIERLDPFKVDLVKSTKGSSPGCFTDDRSVVIVRKERVGNAST